jgi:outer membrane protein assembly factor BamB
MRSAYFHGRGFRKGPYPGRERIWRAPNARVERLLAKGQSEPASRTMRRRSSVGIHAGLGAFVVLALVGATFASPSVPLSRVSVANRSGLAIASSVSGDWVTYLGNTKRTSSSTGETWLTVSDANSLYENWSAATGGVIAASATVARGVAYFGSWDGYEYAVNASMGTVLWKTFLGTDSYDSKCPPLGITSSATVVGDTLYVGGNDNTNGGYNANWYAINTATGQIRWSVSVGNMSKGYYNWASPLIYRGFGYFGVSSDCDQPLVPGGVAQVNLTTHKIQHFFHSTPIYNGSYERGASIWTSPSVDPSTNTVFVTVGNPGAALKIPETYAESIVALNATNVSNVKAHWQVPTNEMVKDGDFSAGPAILTNVTGVKGDLVVAGCKNGFEYAWNASDLHSWTPTASSTGTLWQTNMSHWNATTPTLVPPAAYSNGIVYVGVSKTIVDGVTHAGSLWAIKAATGQVVWNKFLSGPVRAAPLFAHDVLVVGSGPDLFVYRANSGGQLNAFVFSSPFYAAPSIAEGFVFAGNTDGREYALTVH